MMVTVYKIRLATMFKFVDGISKRRDDFSISNAIMMDVSDRGL